MVGPPSVSPRAKAVCVFTNGDLILAVNGNDFEAGRHFWVPVGGGIEHGETSRAAIVREAREEIAAEIADVVLLGVLENIFTFAGELGHEIVFVYDARLIDDSLYDRAVLPGIENGVPFTAHWIDPVSPLHGWPLYPEGMLRLLGR